MITKLNKKQEKLMEEYKKEGLRIGRNTTPINKEKAYAVICKIYEKMGYAKPEAVFCDSPKQCIEMAREMNDQDGHNDEFAWSHFAGDQWCAWEIFYDFARKIGIEYTEEQNEALDMWLEQCKECHWWFPYEGVVFISERPCILKIDANGRLHSENSHAIAYKDGYGLYAWKGIIVEKWIIENPENITINMILEEKNIEMRRVFYERYGMDRFIKDANFSELHRDDFGILYKHESFPFKILRYICPTTLREYTSKVPPNMERAREAMAWKFYQKEEEYAPYIES